MKRIIAFSLLYFFVIIQLMAQNFLLEEGYPFQPESLLEGMTIKSDRIIFEYDESVKKNDEILNYDIQHFNGIPFLVFSENMPMEVAEWYKFEETDYIQTDNKILFLAFKNEKYITMFAYTKGYSFDSVPLTFTRFEERGSLYKDCSSYLIEKSKSYPVENLRKLALDSPWVEGVPGDGIGEGFTIEGQRYSKSLGPYLFIMNGYISYDKPYLYKQNGRIKKIKVTGLKSGKSKILDVLDTPHPQTVEISFITEPEDIRVQIEEVYKGTKYDDTCINYLITYDKPVIPYESTIHE